MRMVNPKLSFFGCVIDRGRHMATEHICSAKLWSFKNTASSWERQR